MADLPLPELSAIRWTESEDEVRSAWRGLSGPGRNIRAQEAESHARDGPDQVCLVGPSHVRGKDRAPGPGESAGVGALSPKLGEQLDDLGLVPVDLLAEGFDLLVRPCCRSGSVPR